MEKGKVKTMSGQHSGGMIEDGQGRQVNFERCNVVSKDRNSLKLNDSVWFEREGGEFNAKAINIRRC